MDDGSTDTREAKVLKYARNYVSIYSNSWGPADTGTFMEHLTNFVKRSLSKGIHQVKYLKDKVSIYIYILSIAITIFHFYHCKYYRLQNVLLIITIYYLTCNKNIIIAIIFLISQLVGIILSVPIIRWFR